MPLVVGCVFGYLGVRPHSMICSTTGGLCRLFLTHWGQLANTATTVPRPGNGVSGVQFWCLNDQLEEVELTRKTCLYMFVYSTLKASFDTGWFSHIKTYRLLHCMDTVSIC